MKKLLLIAALTTLSAPAFASKARLNALGNADHLVDAQTAFDNPAHLAGLPDYVTFEGGPSSVTTATPATISGANWSDIYAANNPKAEGGMLQSHGDAKWGVYLGRVSAFTDTMRRTFGFLAQENPIELQYAMKGGAMNWGAALNYSSSDVKSATQKQSAMGVRLGATADMWEAFAVIGLGQTAEGAGAGALLKGDANGDGIVNHAAVDEAVILAADTKAKMTGTTGFKLGGAYKMDHMRVYGKYYQDGFKYESSTNPNGIDGLKLEQSQLDIGLVDVSKIDGGQWFYGVAYQLYSQKQSGITGVNDKTTTNSYLPFLMGMEYDATSWAVLRAAVTQNVLIGSEKTDDGSGSGTTNFVDDTNTVKNNTKVAAGFGLKMNKWILDGSWTAATSATGAINMNSLLTNVGLTYNF